MIFAMVYLLCSAAALFLTALAERSALRRDIRGANGLVFFGMMVLSVLAGLLICVFYGWLVGWLYAVAGLVGLALWHLAAWQLLSRWIAKMEPRA